MVPSKVRVGVIGVGRMGERHCRVYSSLPNVEFVGVSDASADRGRAMGIRYGVPSYTDYNELLSRVDAVSVVTPTDLHHEVATAAVYAGTHVLVEKPLAGSLTEARNLAWLASEASTVFQVGHIERFNPAFLELQAVVEGLDIVALAARRLSPFDTSNTDVDVVYDLMIHDLDLAVALLGSEVEGVQAYGRTARMDSADYVAANLSMSSGAIASLTASRLTEQKVRVLEITALGAYIEADLLNKSIFIYRRTLPEYVQNNQRPLRYRQEGLVERIHIPTAEPLMLELEDFVRCIREGAQPRVTAQDGLRAMELAAGIRESIQADLGLVTKPAPALLAVAS